MLQQISGPHSGLHYVPSFNDLNSGAADDADEMAVEERRTRNTSSTNRNINRNTTATNRITNKEDDWGTFETADIHKVGARLDCWKGHQGGWGSVEWSSSSRARLNCHALPYRTSASTLIMSASKLAQVNRYEPHRSSRRIIDNVK